MMSGPEPASTAAAVLGCSWSPVTVSTATVTPLASPHALAWRMNSASAGLTKLVHCSRRMEAPLRATGILVVVVVGVDPPHERMISGKARVATATPVVFKKSRRDQPDLAGFRFPFCMVDSPSALFDAGPPTRSILTLF